MRKNYGPLEKLTFTLKLMSKMANFAHKPSNAPVTF